MQSNLVLGSNMKERGGGKMWYVYRTWFKQERKGVKVVQTGYPTGLFVEKGNIGGNAVHSV